MERIRVSLNSSLKVCLSFTLSILLTSCGFVLTSLEQRLEEANQKLDKELEEQNKKDLEQTTVSGDCAGVEFAGVYQSVIFSGFYNFSARVRNNTAQGKFVRIDYRILVSSAGMKKMSKTGKVPANDIESFDLGPSEKTPEDVRIVSCE